MDRVKEGSEKSSAAYVGFRARLAATAAAAATAVVALIRVRRYEIIKLGLDGGEGDGVARAEGEGTEEKEGGSPRWMSEAMGRCCEARRRGPRGGEARGITVFRIPVYERQPRRPFETRATATLVARCRRGRSRSKRTRRSERARGDAGERTEANALVR